jgi:hypothetical protein
MLKRSASVRLLRQQLWRSGHSRLIGSSRQVFLRFSFSFLQKQAGPALLALWLCGRLLLFGCVFASQNPPYEGAAEKKMKKKQPMYTYDGVLFLIAFLSSPYRETPEKNAPKKNRQGGGKLDARPRKTFFITFLSSPHREALNQRNKKNRKERELKKSTRKKKSRPKKYFPGVFF